MVFLKGFFEKLILKKSADDKKHGKLPKRQRQSYSSIFSGAQGIVEADLIATLVSKLKEEVDEIKVSLKLLGGQDIKILGALRF